MPVTEDTSSTEHAATAPRAAGAQRAPTVLVGALLLLYQGAVNEGDDAVLQSRGRRSEVGRQTPALPGWGGAPTPAPAPCPGPLLTAPAPQPGAGRCRGAPGAAASAARDLSGKTQLLTAGVSVFLV